ncbi:sensor histidine kinase [Marivita hallyeonensis]|uniref:histidine kinase n=1 Tax=Marivita hallyeonensis TaxID=996342 RepID=A0A1M5TW46_9RHOB|nr:PAS domain-containing sensor histidine kinase [Marivita hallyeonensis]SHH55007.1 PAS domain S-box-containing protein [Marivita hallyeonensis]
MTVNFEDVFQRAPTPTMVLDRNLVFVAANASYLNLFNLTEDDLLGKYVFDAFPESEDRVQAMTDVFQRTFVEGTSTIAEIPFRIDVNGVTKEQWWTATQVAITDEASGQDYLIQYTENVTERVKLRNLREAMLAELQHRIGNIFTVVSAISRQTGRVAKDVPDFLKRFDQRLTSLIKVNKELSGQRVEFDKLGDVIMHQLSVHAAHSMDRVAINGPDFPLSMLQSQAASMAVHELATNAIKYGALSNAEGEIDVSWELLPGDACRLIWRETGPITPSNGSGAGYGTMLLTTILPNQLDGVAQQEFGEGSFTYTLEIGTR